MLPRKQITLGGKTYTLHLDLNAFAEFETATGKNLLQGGLEKDQLSVTDIRALLWAGLQREHPDMTLQDVGRLVDLDNLKTVSEQLTELRKEALPDPEEGESGKAESTAASAGPSSKASASSTADSPAPTSGA